MRCLFRLFKIVPIIFILISTTALGQEEFYDQGKEGWYWYEKKEPTEQGSEFIKIARDPYTYDQLWKMHPEKFAKVLKERMNLSIQYPTEENAYRYLEIQDAAIRKSSAVAGVMGLVAQKNPKFSNGKYPTTAPGQRALVEKKRVETDNTIISNRDRFALVVFVSDGCGYCDAQKPLLDRFELAYGWKIKYLDIYQFEELANKYAIEMTPSIILVSKEKEDAMSISSGVIGLADLKKRVVRAIRYMIGETKPEQWHQWAGSSDPLKFVNKGAEK